MIGTPCTDTPGAATGSYLTHDYFAIRGYDYLCKTAIKKDSYH